MRMAMSFRDPYSPPVTIYTIRMEQLAAKRVAEGKCRAKINTRYCSSLDTGTEILRQL
jgi:hypothetical protein